MYLVLRRYSDEVTVEGAVMYRTEAESVGYHSLASLLDVTNYVGCIQQSLLFENADRAAMPIRRQNETAEPPLV